MHDLTPTCDEKVPTQRRAPAFELLLALPITICRLATSSLSNALLVTSPSVPVTTTPKQSPSRHQYYSASLSSLLASSSRCLYIRSCPGNAPPGRAISRNAHNSSPKGKAHMVAVTVLSVMETCPGDGRSINECAALR